MSKARVTKIKEDALFIGNKQLLNKSQTKKMARHLNIPIKSMGGLKFNTVDKIMNKDSVSNRDEYHSISVIGRGSPEDPIVLSKFEHPVISSPRELVRKEHPTISSKQDKPKSCPSTNTHHYYHNTYSPYDWDILTWHNIAKEIDRVRVMNKLKDMEKKYYGIEPTKRKKRKSSKRKKRKSSKRKKRKSSKRKR